MFENIFTDFFTKNKEVIVIGVWGKDGLELEKKHFSEINFDLDFTGAEMADIISKIDGIKISPVSFFIKLIIRDYFLIIYSLTPDYFLIILTDRNIIQGKLNFYIDIFKDKLISVL